MTKKHLIPILLLLFGSCSKDDLKLNKKESTSISSPSFEKALIDIGIDSDGVLNGVILNSDISAITYLSLEDNNISDLSGIENFTGLKKLDCYNNRLTSIDISKNKALKEFNCRYNQLTNLDVSQNTALTSLLCTGNQLTNLDISQNTILATLGCSNNQLTSLDVSQNTTLTQLYCSDNLLTSLDVSQNTDLIELFCFYNQLTSLDISQNGALTELYCNDNQLTSLDVKNGNNSILVKFNATANNNLQCIVVDNETAANLGNTPYNVWVKDMSTVYAKNCDTN